MLALPPRRSARIALVALSAFWIVAGLNHFLMPAFYLGIMPPYLPAHLALVQFTGVLELAGGIGVLLRATRALAGKCLVALLIAFLPVHVHMVANPEAFVAQGIPYWALWLRFPVQALFIAWASWATRDRQNEQHFGQLDE